jgi:hypothetical protein
VGQGVSRAGLDEQVHVAGHDLEGHDPPPVRGGPFPGQFPQPGSVTVLQDRAPVLRAPHHAQAELMRGASGYLHVMLHIPSIPEQYI